METKYFRINKNEYCHVSDELVFITSDKEVTRVPLEFTLGEGWGIASVLNYLFFALLFTYVFISVTNLGANFFTNPINYGALFILFYSFIRIKNGFVTSKTPTIQRKKIRSVYFKTPKFSYPRLVIYFDGPEGKVLRRTIPILYKKEALPILEETNLVQVS